MQRNFIKKELNKMNKKSLLIAMPFLALGIAATSGCAKKYDVKIVIYNWEDYIDEGDEDEGEADFRRSPSLFAFTSTRGATPVFLLAYPIELNYTILLASMYCWPGPER